MQTNFSAEQLRNPDFASSNGVLRTCVHCGLCTATCPTFLLLGDELDSPRGRIYLIKDMLEAERPATEDVVRHVDRCLSCLACMTTCPSGVNYMHLVDHARSYIERTYRRPADERLLRKVLGTVLARPWLFRVSLLAARLVRPIAWLMPASGRFGRRLQAMLNLVPRSLPSPSSIRAGQTHRAEGRRRARVALLAGCAQQVLAPEINEATIRILTRSGVDVVVANGSGCCGALTHHMGQHDAAMASARTNIASWIAEIEGDGLDAIVVNASGCGTMVKDYGFMFRAEPEREQAEKISALACDISEFLARFGYAPTREKPDMTVAYHSACSLQHGQRVTAEPKALLQRAGFKVVEPAEAHICCGSAGTYNMLQPDIAARLRERKLGNLQTTQADVIAAGNIGCITQLRGGKQPVVHSVELLDWMAGGPKPALLRGIVLALMLFTAATAHAQSASKPANDKQAALDRLLAALHSAPTEEAAAPLEERIKEMWINQGSPAVTLLMARGLREMKADATNDAIEDFSDAITLDPNLAEAYHQRAIARFVAGDTNGAIADIQATLQHEPRSFAAFQTLTDISVARKDWKGAYDAWQKVLQIDPKTPGGEERLKDLRRRALGEET